MHQLLSGSEGRLNLDNDNKLTCSGGRSMAAVGQRGESNQKREAGMSVTAICVVCSLICWIGSKDQEIMFVVSFEVYQRGGMTSVGFQPNVIYNVVQ